MTEREFEMMDDYLSNRLSAEENAAFEKQVQADPQLAQELTVQKNLVEGLRQARAAELKSMLNNIPVSPIQGGSNVLIKAGTWVVVAGLIATGIYFYSTREQEKSQPEEKVVTEQKPETPPQVAVVPETEAEPIAEKQEEPAPTLAKPAVKKPKSEVSQQTTEPTQAKPMDVYNPEAEEVDAATRQYELEQMENIKKSFVTSSIEVETDTMSKKYNFHYVFKNNKLVLYGTFEKNLYEILEFIGDEKRTVVLYYKVNYYLLDISKVQPTKLNPIHDPKLLKMLKAHRSK
jgi:hypothetical protein